MNTSPFVVALIVSSIASVAEAQSLGTFRWQLQPYCNVVTISVTQQGGNFTLDGFDDQCGAAQRAPLVGLGTPNPDGTIGLGLQIVTVPGGRLVAVDARISPATVSGPWKDSAGNSGIFAFEAAAGGNPRPLPASVPAAIVLDPGGSIVARADGDSAIPASGPGTRLMWYAGKSAFRAGQVNGDQWDDANVGQYSAAFGLDTRAGYLSTAMGFRTQATGTSSTALGSSTYATGPYSTALGKDSVASNEAATAMGVGTLANGPSSTAMGFHSRASGMAATSIGGETRATGAYSVAGGFQSQANGAGSLAFGDTSAANGVASVALGHHAFTTTAATGSFVFADTSNSAAFTSFAPGEFVVRASGGVGFYTNAAATTGAEMAPGGGSWAALSDANMKENFREVPGEDVLTKLAAMPIREWNYTSQDPRIRHMGPTAQDFRAAFGLGDFPLRINTTDADGIALAGVKALEARTRALSAENAALRQALDDLSHTFSEERAVMRWELQTLRQRVEGPAGGTVPGVPPWR